MYDIIYIYDSIIYVYIPYTSFLVTHTKHDDKYKQKVTDYR